MIPNLNCSLKYNKNNLDKIDINNKLNITGKNLNLIPKELFENDNIIFSKILFFYKTLKELTGENVDGLIDHTILFESIIKDIKNNDELLSQKKLEFLKLNDCNLKIEDVFPCVDLKKCDIKVYFENTHIHYSENYINNEYSCDSCNNIVNCEKCDSSENFK